MRSSICLQKYSMQPFHLGYRAFRCFVLFQLGENVQTYRDARTEIGRPVQPLEE